MNKFTKKILITIISIVLASSITVLCVSLLNSSQEVVGCDTTSEDYCEF